MVPFGRLVHSAGLQHRLQSASLQKEAEAVGVKEVLSWVKSLNLSRVVVEVDAFKVFKGLQFFDHDRSVISPILADCISLAHNWKCAV